MREERDLSSHPLNFNFRRRCGRRESWSGALGFNPRKTVSYTLNDPLPQPQLSAQLRQAGELERCIRVNPRKTVSYMLNDE